MYNYYLVVFRSIEGIFLINASYDKEESDKVFQQYQRINGVKQHSLSL